MRYTVSGPNWRKCNSPFEATFLLEFVSFALIWIRWLFRETSRDFSFNLTELISKSVYGPAPHLAAPRTAPLRSSSLEPLYVPFLQLLSPQQSDQGEKLHTHILSQSAVVGKMFCTFILPMLPPSCFSSDVHCFL